MWLRRGRGEWPGGDHGGVEGLPRGEREVRVHREGVLHRANVTLRRFPDISSFPGYLPGNLKFTIIAAFHLGLYSLNDRAL